MDYLGSVASSALSTLFIIFIIAALGYALGAIKIKGISLGTAGVLVVALVVGVVFRFTGTLDSANNLTEVAFNCGNKLVNGVSTPIKIVLWSGSVKSLFTLVSNIGTGMFVTSVGLIAGPKFFRSFNKSTLSYLLMGVILIVLGMGLNVVISAIDPNMDIAMGTGLLTGALTSTPGLSAAKDAASAVGGDFADKVTAGYGIGYLYGVIGVVLFVQILPKILKVDIAKERESFVAAAQIKVKETDKKLWHFDSLGFFPFMLTVAIGLLIGSVKIPINYNSTSGFTYFSLGSSGGTLVAGLIVGHFGHIGKVSLEVPKKTLEMFRELGLVLFLIGAGLPGGINFVSYFNPLYLVYGVIFTTVPMIVGFILGKYVFKLSIFNNLGSITGGMTSTPALGSLISVAGTDEVASAYAATYPVALVLIVIFSNLAITLLQMI